MIMMIAGLAAFGGVVVFSVLYILFFLKGMSLKIPLIGMVACFVLVAAAGVLNKLGIFAPKDGDDSAQTSQSEAPDGEGDADSQGETVSEQVLLDKRGIVITATGLDKEGTFGPGLKVLIENNSETNVTVQVRDVSVNSYMMESVFSVEVEAGKSANDSITLLSSSIQNCGINTIADMEFSFHIFDDNLTTFLDSDLVQIRTSAADTYQYSYDDSGEELYNGNGVRIVSKGFDSEQSIFGPGLVLFLENTTDEDITVQVRDVSVNGFMVDTIFSEDILAGKRSVSAITVLNASLQNNGIEEIEEMEFCFVVSDQDGWDTIFDTEKIVVSAAQE